MKLWITGENSFISKNFVRWNEENGKRYEVVNRLENDYYNYFRNYSIGSSKKEIDIFDPTLPTLIDKSGADVILHNAAIVGTDCCTKNPDAALRTNIEGTLHVIEAAKKIGIPLIFISTSVCYKPTDSVIKEDSEIEPQTIYGMTKLAGELLLKTWMKKDYVIVIPAMLFGAYDLHSASNKLIMSGLGKIGETVQIFLDPEKVKPFMYIDNYLEGLDLVIQNLDKLNTKRINIAPDDSKLFEDIINYLIDDMSLDPTFELHPAKDYLENHVLDNSFLKSLGWKQKFSLEEGLEKVREILENQDVK